MRNTIRKMIDNDKKEKRETKKAEMKLRQTLRKSGEYNEDFKDETIRELVNKYTDFIDEDLKKMEYEDLEKEALKIQREAAKKEKKDLKEQKEKRKTKKAQKDVE